MDRRLIVLAAGMFAIGTDSFVVAGVLPQVADSLGCLVALAGQMVTLYALSYALLSPVIAATLADWPRKRLLLVGLAVFVVRQRDHRRGADHRAGARQPRAGRPGRGDVQPDGHRHRRLAGAARATRARAGDRHRGPVERHGPRRADGNLHRRLAGLARDDVVRRHHRHHRRPRPRVALLPQIPMPPSVSLARRLQPLADARVLLTLLTTWLAYGGLFLVYTYIGLSFAGATGGDARVLAILLLVWGVAATIGNLVAGRLTDRFGSRRIINGAIALVAIDFALLPWTAGTLSTAVPALVVWGLCGWGLLVPQQHRLIGIDPASAPLLLGLNSAALYCSPSASP
jgi:DHA1 family inner membrane transport protein